jgi:hypothetical protein
MLGTSGNRFNWWATNGATPAASTYGTTLTAGSTAHTLGSTVELLSAAAVTSDVYGVLICMNGGQFATQARDFLLNIVTDPAGGTAWGTVIPNLLATSPGTIGSATSAARTVGVWYYFPLFIKAGSSIGGNCQSAAANVLGVAITVFGRPSRPEMMNVGQYVTAFGANTATSGGTAASATYAQMGANLTRPHWWWQVGYGCTDATQTGAMLMVDLARGTATTKDVIFENFILSSSVDETLGIPTPMRPDYYCEVPTGQGIYAKLRSSATLDTGTTLVAYGLGG